MNIVDGISAAYVALGALRGRKRGVAEEAYRVLRIGIAFAAGCGLYSTVSSLIGKALSLGGASSGPIGFLGTMAGTLWVLSFVKQGLTAWIASRFTQHTALAGAIAGALRNTLVIFSVVATLHLAWKLPGHDAVRSGSFVGKLVERILPGQ